MVDTRGSIDGVGARSRPSAEDVELIDALSCEVEELLQGVDEHIRKLRGFIFSIPFDHDDYISFLSGLEVDLFLESLKSVNRFVHTVKGNAGFMNLNRLKTYCHRVEELTVGIMGGKLYLDREGYALVEQIPNVIARFFERIRQTCSDEDVPVERELEEIDRIRERISKAVGATEIQLATFQKQDFGLVRRSNKSLKISMDLAKLDSIVTDYQIAMHTVIGLFQTLGADAEKVSEVTQALSDHLERLLSAGEDRMVLTRYQRIVTDLSRALGKEVDFTVGRNSALARPDVWDHCHNAMVHLVRNAVDHGIEPPGDRMAAGKPRRGSISLDLWEDHKTAFIELKDDGRGIDPGKVAAAALARKVVSERQLAAMSPADIQKLVFRAGFSTAEKTTDVSGRGVGMDAVIKEVEGNLGGKLVLDSTSGWGTTVRIEIPKSEALTECVLFGAGEEAFAIPKVRDMYYLDCDPARVEPLLAHTTIYAGEGRPFPLLPVMALLYPEEPSFKSLKGHTIIHLAGEKGDFGIAVPEVFGHRRMKVERKKAWDTVIGPSDVVYGYGLTNPVTVVLDLEKLEEFALT